MRLNAYLARAGVASRRKADELIKAGRVTVNGEAGQLNTFVGARDRVEVDGTAVAPQRLAYVLLHKPAGVVTTASDPQGRRIVVELEDGRSAPARAQRLGPSRVELTVHEGRKHQVKRMLEAVGHPVTRLHRSVYAGISADDLEPGAWRELTRDEVARLKATSLR